MKRWIQYAFLCASVGLIIGGYLTNSATGDGYQVFIYSAPVAAFASAGLFWKMIVGNDQSPPVTRIVITGLLTGTVSHYVTFVLIAVLMNICHWTTGGCTGSLGDPPASIAAMLTGAFGYSFFSLLLCGWITAPVAVMIGLALKGLKNTTESRG